MAKGKTFALEDSRDLLWAEVLTQALLNIRPYFWVDAFFPFTGLPFLASLFCLPVAVATRPSISGKFAAYGRDVTSYLFGYRPQGRANFHGLINVIPFFPGKVCIAHTPLDLWLDGEANGLSHLVFSFNLEGVALAT